MAIVESEGSLVSAHRETSLSRSSLTMYSGHVQEYAELYRRQPNLRLVVRFLGRNIGQLRLKAYRKTSPTERHELDPTHKLARFLKNPTPAAKTPTTQFRWVRGIVEDLALYDRIFGLKFRNEAAGELNFIRVPPPMMKITGDSFFWPEGFQFLGNKKRPTFDPGDVVYMHGHDPTDPKAGVSSAEALRQILAEDVAASQHREQMWQRGARIGGMVSRPAEAPKWKPETRIRFKEELTASMTNLGPEAGGTLLLEDGMTYIPAAFSAKEAEYLGARRLTREECAAQYFIPPAFVGILENANFSNIKEQHTSLYTDTLGPWMMWLTQELEAQILPEFDDVDDVYLEFNIGEKLRGNFEERAAAMMSAIGAPFMTRNEGRALDNLPPDPDGDRLVVPLNVLVGGQAAPNDTDTSSLARPASTKSGTKTASTGTDLPEYLIGWEAKHVELLEGFFTRQGASVIAKVGAGVALDTAFDSDRWNDELTTELLAVGYAMSADVGGALAEEYDAEFDADPGIPWLETNARIAAESINASTLSALDVAESGVPHGTASRKALDDELDDILGDDAADDDAEPAPDPLDPLRDVFSIALLSRAFQTARTRTTSVGNWARRESAEQIGLRRKKWNARSGPESRHTSLDGEVVDLGTEFSNGGQFPGDPALGVDETAGCTCDLSFTMD